MEITQFTYFQQVGSLDCNPITGEITYGLERMSMYLQDVESVYDLAYTDTMKYRDVFFQNEVEQTTYALDASDADKLFGQFALFEGEAKRLLEAKLPLPGYEMILKAAHTFNLLDARGAISVTERAAYIGRIRALSRLVASAYVASREALGFPMLGDEARGSCRAIREGRRMSARATLVVELLTEELPPKALRRLGDAFAEALANGLRERGFLATVRP
jgi:glycyl-tRNA synthetase alpha chain